MKCVECDNKVSGCRWCKECQEDILALARAEMDKGWSMDMHKMVGFQNFIREIFKGGM